MFNLRPYQYEAVESVFTYYGEGGLANIVLAMPTGTGKSLVIAELVRLALEQYPGQRFIMATHVKELVEQNAEKLKEHWPNAPVGIHNAALNRRDTVQPIIFGSVQSMLKNVDKFGHRDLLIVDECHLISPNDNTQYRQFIEALKARNPALKVIGLTATPYRMRQGMITDGGIFSHIRYDLTGVEAFNRLIDAGYLCPLAPKPTDTQINVDGVGVRNGEFIPGQLQNALDKDEITQAAMAETVDYGVKLNRQSWLVFTAGVEHAESAAITLRQMGVNAQTMHSKLKKSDRNERIAGFKSGQIQCLVTNNMLTTGFDHPPIDLIAVLRPTLSPGLWVQILGRGTRMFPGKDNCLVLDFAKNTPRLGPINDPRIPNKPGKPTGDIPVKICESCNLYNHASARFCGGSNNRESAILAGGCGAEFSFETKYFQTAGNDQLIRRNEEKEPKIVKKKVSRVWYREHLKGTSKTMRVDYICGVKSYSEWVPFEHFGAPRQKAIDWWMQRHSSEPPVSVAEALELSNELITPTHIEFDANQKYPEILRHYF